MNPAVDSSDYVSLILSASQIPPASIGTLFLLSLMRIAPVISIAPFLGAKLPSFIKMGITLILAALFLPKVIHTAKLPIPSFNVHFAFYALKELLFGFVIAFLASIPFFIAQSSGILIDFLRGSSSLMTNDPVIQNQTSSIGLLYNYVFIVIFYQINGPITFFEGLLNSYSFLPINAALPTQFLNVHNPLWQTLLSLLTQFTALSIQLAAPSIVAILMAETFLGIANRLAPQVQIAFLGMPLKSLLGIALLWAGWFLILQQLSIQSSAWFRGLDLLLQKSLMQNY